MSKHVAMTILIVLPIGLAGGAAASYLWLRTHDPCHVETPSGHEKTPLPDDHDHDHDHDHTPAAGHSEHDEHEEGAISLSDEMIRQLGIEVAEAASGDLESTLSLPGEIVLHADRVAHIVPRVAGMVREVRKSIGDRVEAGELMAVLESRELAEAKAADLAAEAGLRLAESNYKRVDELVQKKISPEQEIHEARQKLEEARIAHQETVAKLHALGQDHALIGNASGEGEADFSRYEVRAPFAGLVIDKHVVLGEVHDSSSGVFIVADLSTVWADITLYAQHMNTVRPGAKVRITAPTGTDERQVAESSIFFVSPIVRESTRTGLARAAISNSDGRWKPGLFVTAEIVLGTDAASVLVPSEAIQTVEGQTVVFVADDDRCFEKRPVSPGRRNSSHTEIVSGLKPGERYVTSGAFVLKAELSKGTGGHEH